MLTALGTVDDRIAGLDAGADDYLVKPFDLDELSARLRALCRRTSESTEVLRIGAGLLDLAGRDVVLADGTRVALSAREFELLRVLAARPERRAPPRRAAQPGLRRGGRARPLWTPTSTTCGASSAVR